jgi:hypothetical protein
MGNEDIDAEAPMNRGELEAMVDALVIAAIEKAAPKEEPEEESFRARLQRERDERIQLNRDKKNPVAEDLIEPPGEEDEEMPKDRGDLEAMIAKEVIAAIERGREEDPLPPPAHPVPFFGGNQNIFPQVNFPDLYTTAGDEDSSEPLQNSVFNQTIFRTGYNNQHVHPFNITVFKKGTASRWSVGPANLSTIIDGTNGDSLDIANLDKATRFLGKKYLVVRGNVSSLVVTSLEVIAVDEANLADEVGLDDDGGQNEIRLLLGTVTAEGGRAWKTQHYFTAARLTYGFLNAKIVRVFESAPTHHTPSVEDEEEEAE